MFSDLDNYDGINDKNISYSTDLPSKNTLLDDYWVKEEEILMSL